MVAFIEANAMKNFVISTIAITVGSRHPFIPISETAAFIKKCRTEMTWKMILQEDKFVQQLDY